MGLTRVARTAAATLEHTFYVGETATDSTTTVTVAITDANGASVDSGNAVSAGASRYTFALEGQAALQVLTVAWTGTISGATVVETDTVEIVGGFFFTLVEGRGSDSSLSDTSKYTTPQLTESRVEVEQECEEICDRAFVPRYGRLVLDGTGTSELMLTAQGDFRTADIRTIRAVRVAPRAGETFVPLSPAELAKLAITPDRVLKRVDGNIWTEERSNVIVEYEYGMDAPSRDLVRAAKIRFRSRLNIPRTNIPDRALSYTTAEGTSYRLSLPEAYRTGIPDVDAIYSRYSLRSGTGTGEDGRNVPASRQLNFDPQHHSLFHGGVR
jgi:hypothetical protein